MQMTLRWYGSKHDTVTLKQIRQIPGVKGVITTLYDTQPGEVWSQERIRAMKEEVEAAGPSRLDNKSILKLYGCVPSDEHIPDQGKIIDEYSHKISLSKNEQFLNDVMGKDNVNMNQVPKEKVFTDPSLVKDRI
jgi:D-mannonate dehydratase